MIRTRPGTHASLLPSVGYAIAGAACWAWQEEAPAFLFPAAAFLFSAAAVSLWAWMLEKFSLAMKTIQKPDAVSEQTRIIEAISRMSDNQATVAYLYLNYEPPDEPAPLDPVIETPEGEISKSFAISALNSAVKRDGHLEPVRNFSDGTPKRRQMELLARWLVSEGLAEPAASNKSVRVTDTNKAIERIIQ